MLDEPIRIEAEGPFHTNEGKLPAADIELRVGADGGGQTVTSGVLTIGDRAFLKFQDVYYEQPQSAVRAANRALRRSSGAAVAARELGLDPRRGWPRPRTRARRGGGRGDPPRVRQPGRTAPAAPTSTGSCSRSGSAVGGATGQTPPHAAERRGSTSAEAVEDPSFDIYMGKEDDVIRRVSGRIEFEVPEASRAGLGGSRAARSVLRRARRRERRPGGRGAGPRAPALRADRSLGGGALAEGLGGGDGPTAAGRARAGPAPADRTAAHRRRRPSAATRSASTRPARRTPRSCSAAPSC